MAITFWQVECFLEGTHGVKIDRMGKTGAKLPRAYWDRLVTTRFKKCIIFHAFRYQFHQYWSRFFHGPMALKFYLVVCLLLLVLSLSVPINTIVLLWALYLRLKVWLRYWGLGCELIQKYYTSRKNIVNLKSDLRFHLQTQFKYKLFHILHITSLLTGDMNSLNWTRSQCVAS